MTALVDIVIPTLNRPHALLRAVASVASHEALVSRLVVVNDGWEDLNEAAIRRAAEPCRTVIVHSGRSGVSSARNLGASHGNAPYLSFLDDDDALSPGWSAAVDALHRRVAVVFGAVERVGLPPLLPHDLGPHFGHIAGNVLTGSWIVARSVFGEVGGYSPELGYGENVELLLRVSNAVGNDKRATVALDASFVAVNSGLQVGDRASANHRNRAASAVYMAEVHHEQLSRFPPGYAAILRAGAVAAARSGDWQLARSLMRSTLAQSDAKVRDGLRLALTHCPPLGSAVWCRR